MPEIRTFRYRFLAFLRKRPTSKAWIVLSPSFIWILLFSIVPILIVLYYSFLTRGEWGQVLRVFTLENYQRFSLIYVRVFLRSIRLAASTAFLCFLIGFAIAYWIAIYGGTRKNFLIFLIIIPSWTSLLIRIYAWLFLFRDSGLINHLLLKAHFISSPIPMTFNVPGVIACMVYTYLPFMMLPLYASLVRLNRSVLEAALDLGATPFRRLVRVTFPLAKGGIVSGCVLVFIPALGEYLVPDLVGGAKVVMMGNLIGSKFLEFRNWPLGSALAIVVLTVILALIFFYVRITRKRGLFEEL